MCFGNNYNINYDMYGARGPQFMMQNQMGFMAQGPMGMGGPSIFQNVFGDVDYDAVAGNNVAQALFGVLDHLAPRIIDMIHAKKNKTQEE